MDDASYLKMLGGSMPGGRNCISPYDQCIDLGGGDVGIDVRAEIQLDDADAQQRARLDVVEMIAARQRAFQRRDDALLHVRGGHAAIGSEDDHDRHFELRQDVRRRALVAHDPQDERPGACRPRRGRDAAERD